MGLDLINAVPPRSVLYVPASNFAAIAKTRTLSCDAVIFDLEDSVAPGSKSAAREHVVLELNTRLELRKARSREHERGPRAGSSAPPTLIVRVNGVDTDWGAADVQALATAWPDALLFPKVDDEEDIRRCDSLLASAPARTRLWTMIETTRSVFRLEAMAAQSRTTRLSAFVIGTNDLCVEMRASIDVRREPLHAILSLAVVAARAHGLTIIDGVFNHIDDDEGFEEQCRQGAALGFDGKTLIHPRQIESCHRIFTPSDTALASARAIVAAFNQPENRGAGVLKVDGRMVERLHLDQALALISLRKSIDRESTPQQTHR